MIDQPTQEYKIIDFGEHKQADKINNTLMNASIAGTPLFLSPEILNAYQNNIN